MRTKHANKTIFHGPTCKQNNMSWPYMQTKQYFLALNAKTTISPGPTKQSFLALQVEVEVGQKQLPHVAGMPNACCRARPGPNLTRESSDKEALNDAKIEHRADSIANRIDQLGYESRPSIGLSSRSTRSNRLRKPSIESNRASAFRNNIKAASRGPRSVHSASLLEL